MKKLLIAIIVFIVAVFLSVIFIPFGIVYGITYRVIYKRDFGYISEVLMSISVALDKMDNMICGDFLNQTFVKQGEPFGDGDLTVSETMAKNKSVFTSIGAFIARVLEFIDPGHLQKSLTVKTK